MSISRIIAGILASIALGGWAIWKVVLLGNVLKNLERVQGSWIYGVDHVIAIVAILTVIGAIWAATLSSNGTLGPKGDKGDPGDKGDQGDPGTLATAPLNPTLPISTCPTSLTMVNFGGPVVLEPGTAAQVTLSERVFDKDQNPVTKRADLLLPCFRADGKPVAFDPVMGAAVETWTVKLDEVALSASWAYAAEMVTHKDIDGTDWVVHGRAYSAADTTLEVNPISFAGGMIDAYGRTVTCVQQPDESCFLQPVVATTP